MLSVTGEQSPRVKRGPYAVFLKRLIDIVGSFCGLLILALPLLVIAILVRTKLGSPVIFKQYRPGKIDKKAGEEKIFTLYKFRTMTDAADENGMPLPDEVRLTKFGAKLRSLSLDELPELWNILKGDMSIVGPRPLLVEYLSLYTPEQHCRHAVRPGLTGYAQVNGRNALSWEERFHLDVAYTRHITFFGDCKIILQTVKAVLKREGISGEGSVTMEAFRGTEALPEETKTGIEVGE